MSKGDDIMAKIKKLPSKPFGDSHRVVSWDEVKKLLDEQKKDKK